MIVDCAVYQDGKRRPGELVPRLPAQRLALSRPGRG
jgi:hypothetical protein